jgi:hypothetical protein
MSAARREVSAEASERRTPVSVWVVYVLGILAVAVFLLTASFILLAYFTLDDQEFGIGVSTPALIIWGGLIVAAVATWLWRRRGERP